MKIAINKTTKEQDVVKGMNDLGFELIFEHHQKDKYSSGQNSKDYLFLHKDMGLCSINYYGETVSSIHLFVNYASKDKENGFRDKFYNSNWGSSSGVPSGYGYSMVTGDLSINDLEKSLEEIQKKGRLIVPYTELPYIPKDNFIPEDILKGQDILARTSWFFENLVDPKHLPTLGNLDRQRHETEVLMYWDDYIRWNKPDCKISKKDKQFYTTAKSIVLSENSNIQHLLTDNFFYHTTDLGQNFCHLMALVQDSHKKEQLWNKFESLSVEHQTAFITQNDSNGYNPLLMVLQHSGIRPVKDHQLNLTYFKKFLSVPGIESSFYNDKNSLLDCVLYSKTQPDKTIDYLKALIDEKDNIPKIYLEKDKAFSSKQKVVKEFNGHDTIDHLRARNYDVVTFIEAYELNKKMNQILEPKEKKIKSTKI